MLMPVNTEMEEENSQAKEVQTLIKLTLFRGSSPSVDLLLLCQSHTCNDDTQNRDKNQKMSLQICLNLN